MSRMARITSEVSTSGSSVYMGKAGMKRFSYSAEGFVRMVCVQAKDGAHLGKLQIPNDRDERLRLAEIRQSSKCFEDQRNIDEACTVYPVMHQYDLICSVVVQRTELAVLAECKTSQKNNIHS